MKKVKLPSLFKKKKNKTPQNNTTPTTPQITVPVQPPHNVAPQNVPPPIVTSPSRPEEEREREREPEREIKRDPGTKPVPRPAPVQAIVIHSPTPPRQPARQVEQKIDPQVNREVDELMADLNTLLQQPSSGPAVITVKDMDLVIDYSPIARLRKGQEGAYIDAQVSRLLGRPFELGRVFMGTVGKENPEMAQWFLRALCFLTANQETLGKLGVQPKALVQRLINTAKKQVRVSMSAPNHGFEMQVLQVGGLMRERLLLDCSALNDQTKGWLLTLYNPGKNPEKIIGPLDPGLLRTLMRTALTEVVVSEYKVWHTKSGNFTEPHPIKDIGEIADFIQGFLKEKYGEFPLAAIESPYHNGWTYSHELLSTESKPGDDAELLGWLVNRGDYVGYGGPYTQANYNPNRPEDKNVLLAIYKELLGHQNFRKYLKKVSQLTACHTKGTGKVMVQPWYHNPEVTTHVQFRWKRARTLIHEFLHALTHKNVYDVKAGHKQILLEGFTELITVEVFKQLILQVQADDKTRKVILGEEEYADPDPKYLQLGYADAGVKATLIAKRVGLNNILAAYFLGETKLIGL
ncbi:hypothetical protein ABZ912_03825 [Nonomuraea angiospora]|uniref:hypothetical protein n=1 Tax=Nonomuraea angiospora TaxID=46172 RepID=UPI0033C516DD